MSRISVPLRSLGTACWVSHPHVYTLHVEENSYPIGRYHVEMPSPKRISKASRRYSEQYQSTQLKSSDRHRLRWTNIVNSWEQDTLSVSFLSFFLLFLFNTEIIYSSPSKMRRTVSYKRLFYYYFFFRHCERRANSSRTLFGSVF